jgi:hypothetical protein
VMRDGLVQRVVLSILSLIHCMRTCV